ncbi:MAG: MATE family efflux transporter [Oscillospiraceae bacterium]|nr:MATE family efflux transporter [Oscillospiraceae bacterium]
MQQKENKMGTMPVNKLLMSVSLPIMISMLVQALYNIVDSIFVAKYSPAGFTAISLAFPAQSLMISLAVGTGVGINSLLSRRLGEKRFDEANKAATNGIFLSFLSSLLFAVLGFVFSYKFFSTFTKDTEVINYGTEYLTICTVLSIGVFMQVTLERLLQATGNSLFSMFTQGAGAVMNIIFDPILIFGYLGFPEMGIKGAAIATVCGQIFAAVLGVVFNIKKNKEISLSFKGFRPSAGIIADIYRVGVPSIIMQSIVSVMTALVNKILDNDTAVSVMGAYFKIQSFIFMPIFGLTNGMVPIVGYNFGAKKKDRIYKTIHSSLFISMSVMAVGTLVFLFLPGILLKIFSADDALMKMGVPALRIMGMCFVTAGVCIVISSSFQAIGCGMYSLIISLVRQLIFLVPIVFVMKILFGLGAVWWAFPISDIISLIITLLLYANVKKKYIEPIKSE